MTDTVPFLPEPGPASVDPRLAGGRLVVDLQALTENYRLLAARAGPAGAAGIVKADAYGLGAAQVAPVLWENGCRTFFVALPQEGVTLRAILPQAEIFVLSGPLGAEAAPALAQARLYPVLNSPADISTWEAWGWDGEAEGPRPCAVHVDTGMNRLGLDAQEARAFAAENAITGAVTPLVVMSHLACADEPAHPLNRRQAEAFAAIAAAFPQARASLANSAGLFIGDAFRFDLARPGIALYGGAPVNGMPNPMRAVAAAQARVLQIRAARAGETVSYGARAQLARDTLIAIASVGYADGLHRQISGAGVPLRALTPGGAGFVHGARVPVLGRVTMDLTLFDVTELGPDAVRPGDHIELFGPNIALDEAAAAAGTISYELLTALGRRYHRQYLPADRAS